jgi:hypothetical protein
VIEGFGKVIEGFGKVIEGFGKVIEGFGKVIEGQQSFAAEGYRLYPVNTASVAQRGDNLIEGVFGAEKFSAKTEDAVQQTKKQQGSLE